MICDRKKHEKWAVDQQRFWEMEGIWSKQNGLLDTNISNTHRSMNAGGNRAQSYVQ